MAAGKPPSPELDELDLGLPEPPEGDIPDLSLPAPPPASAAAVATARGDDAGGFDDGFDDGFGDGDGPRPVTGLALQGATDPPEQRRPLPTGVTPDVEALNATVVDVHRAAGYGPPPTAWYQAPAYTIRVFRRRRELLGETARLARALTAAEDDRDHALGGLVGALWSQLERDGRFGELLQRVSDTDREASAASSDLAATDASFRAELGRLDQARAACERQRTDLLEIERQREAEQAQRERGLERAEARLQRLGIEHRNGRRLEEQAAQADSEVRLPDGHAARMAELAAQIPELMAEVDQHRGLFKDATALVKQAQAETQRVGREIRRLEGERRGLEGKFASESSSRAASLGAAERARRTARADVGRAVLRCDLGAAVDPAELDALRAHDETVRRAAREHLCATLGLDAFERGPFGTGRTLLALLLAALLGAVVLVVANAPSCGGDAEPPSRKPDSELLHGALPASHRLDLAQASPQSQGLTVT